MGPNIKVQSRYHFNEVPRRWWTKKQTGRNKYNYIDLLSIMKQEENNHK